MLTAGRETKLPVHQMWEHAPPGCSWEQRLLVAASIYADHESWRLLRRDSLSIEQAPTGMVKAEWREIGPLGPDFVHMTFTPVPGTDLIRIVKTSVICDFSGTQSGTEIDRIETLDALEGRVAAFPSIAERLREHIELLRDLSRELGGGSNP